MNEPIDAERILDAFLAPESERLSDRVIDAALADIARTPQRRALRAPWRFALMPALPRATSVAALALVVAVAAGAFVYLNSPGGASLGSSPTALPSAVTSPTAEADAVKGWPGNRGSSAPGLYSWDEVTCEPTNCIMGVLHSHGSDDGTDVESVRISISRITEWSISDASATPVTVAGHQGLYLHSNPQLEGWNVDFDGTLLSITLSVGSGADEAVVDEAYSIIESLVYEQRDTPLGFRLVFRLPSGRWDSPF
jgi:hypothetical protein